MKNKWNYIRNAIKFDEENDYPDVNYTLFSKEELQLLLNKSIDEKNLIIFNEITSQIKKYNLL